MLRLLKLCAWTALLIGPVSLFGQALSGINGDCHIGGQQTLTSGLPSTATQQIGTTNVNAGAGVDASFPSCLVAAYATGTTNKANIYSNNTLTPTLLSNPFLANVDGSFTLFVAAGCYDVVMSSGAGPALPYTRTLGGICVGQGTVVIPGGSGTVGSCATIGALTFYQATGTTVTCDPLLTTNGSGGVTGISLTLNGPSAGFVGYTQGTVPSLSVANTAYLYSDTSVPTTFGTALPSAPGTIGQGLVISQVVDGTHIKLGYGGSPICASGCVILAPTTDQTITGSHQLINLGTGQTGPAISSFNSFIQSNAYSAPNVAVSAQIINGSAAGLQGIAQGLGATGVWGLAADVNPAGADAPLGGGFQSFLSATSSNSGGPIGFASSANASPAVGTTITNSIGLYGLAENTGAGTVTNTRAVLAQSNLNTGGGLVTNNYGYDALAQTVGSVNAAFHSVDQGSGASNYGILLDGVTHNNLGGGLTQVGSFLTSSTGVFTAGAQQEYFQSILNGCNPSNEYFSNHANYATEALTGCVASPNGAAQQANAVAGYATTLTNSVVAGYFQTTNKANNTFSDAVNGVCQDIAGLTTGVSLICFDANVQPQNATGVYSIITGYNAAMNAPTAGSFGNAYLVQLFGGSVGHWDSAFDSGNGATIKGLVLGTQFASGSTTSVPSQEIAMGYYDSGSAGHQVFAYTDSTGLFTDTGAGFSGPVYVFSDNTNTGTYEPSNNVIGWKIGGNARARLGAAIGAGFELFANESYAWNPNAVSGSFATADTMLSRLAPGVISADTSAPGNGLGTYQAIAFSSSDGSFGSKQTNTVSACETSSGITTLSGASTTTGLTCLPANAIIDAITYRVTTTITTAVSFTVGDSGSATRYSTCYFSGGAQSMTAGATGVCNAGYFQNGGTALGVKITPNTSPGAGALRLIVYYHTWTAPTS